MHATDGFLGRCSCSNTKRCKELQMSLAVNGFNKYSGNFTIRNRNSPKSIECFKKAKKWLGISPNTIDRIHIRKHHFDESVLDYMQNTSKYVTTPINFRCVIAHGLKDFVECYINKQEYMFVPNKSYISVEKIISTAQISKKLNTRREEIKKKLKVVEEEEQIKALKGITESQKNLLTELAELESEFVVVMDDIKQWTKELHDKRVALLKRVDEKKGIYNKILELKKEIGSQVDIPIIVPVIDSNIICSECGTKFLPTYSIAICASCSRKQTNKNYHKRKTMDGDSSKGGLHVNHRYMAPFELHDCVKRQKSTITRLKQTNNRLITRYEKMSKDMEMNFEDGSIVQECIQSALKSLNNDKPKLLKTIMDSVFSVLAKDSEVKSAEVNEFSNFMVEQISNLDRKMNHDKGNQKYSPKLLRIALAIWSRSKKAYEYLRDSNLLMLPDRSTLYRLKQMNKVDEGFNPFLYSRFFDEFVSQNKNSPVLGHLMVDEMKLKAGILFNRSHEVKGFFCEGNGFNLDKEIKDLLKGGKKQKKMNADEEETPEIVTNVNQWRFRTVLNECRNLEFFFNKGDATGSELLRQMIHVVMMLSLIDVVVVGLTLDAGGNNAKFVKYLLGQNHNLECGWLHKCWFRNVFLNMESKIFVWFCSTHNLKSMRNQLKASSGSEKATRHFHDVENTYFGWSGVVNQWNDELIRMKRNNLRLTDLSIDAVNPDKWNKMRVTFAKAVFSKKTLSHGISHHSTLLNCEQEIAKLKIDKTGERNGKCTYTKRVNALVIKSNEKPNTTLFVKSNISCLQFRTYVGALFNDIYMQKKVQFNRSNIENIEIRIKYILSYFFNWYKCRENREKCKDSYEGKLWNSSVLSPITYYNIRLGAIGFLEYSKYLLFKYPHVEFIPCLHSNTSSLEAHFSLMRWYGADTASNYENTFNIVDNEKSMKIMEGNKMYEGNKETYVTTQCNTKARLYKKKCTVLENEKISDSTSFIYAFDVYMNEANIKKIQGLWSGIGDSFIYGSYKRHLLENTSFRNYCYSAMGTSNETTIIYFLNTTDEEEEIKINTTCQQIMTKLLLCLDLCITSKKSHMTDSFWANVFTFIKGESFDTILNMLPLHLQKRTFITLVTFNLLTHFEYVVSKCVKKQKVTEEKDAPEQDAPVVYNPTEIMSEVHRFVGWALKSRRDILQKDVFKLRREKNKDKKLKQLLEERKIIDAIITCENEVLDDSEYMEKYYPIVDQMYNEGGLTLVAKDYLPWARQLIVLINMLVNKETMKKKKNLVMKDAVRSIQGNTNLYKMFHTQYTKDHVVSEETSKKCHNAILLKTIHARCGLVFLIFTEQFLGHYSKMTNVSFRTDLQVTSKKKKKKTIKKEKRESEAESNNESEEDV